MPASVVFFDTAAPDSGSLKGIYALVIRWKIASDGKFSHKLEWPLEGVMREGPSAKRIYPGAADVSATLAIIETKGGSIDAPRFEVPGVVVPGLFRDPAAILRDWSS